jgi:hypothetical protein
VIRYYRACNGACHAGLFAATRLAENHASMYGAVDLASDDIGGLLDRALPDGTIECHTT